MGKEKPITYSIGDKLSFIHGKARVTVRMKTLANH